jgi:hypothetical protein
MAALGRRLNGRAVRRGKRREPLIAHRVNAIFADHDLLLTPVTTVQSAPVEKWHGAGMIRTLLGGSAYVTYTAPWNYLGQPAASIPGRTRRNRASHRDPARRASRQRNDDHLPRRPDRTLPAVVTMDTTTRSMIPATASARQTTLFQRERPARPSQSQVR